MSHWSYHTPPHSLAAPSLSLFYFLLYLFFTFLHAYQLPFFPHSLWCFHFSRTPSFPSITGRQHPNYASQMQILSYLRRDLRWRRAVHQLRYTPLKYFPSVSEGYCLFEGYQWELLNKALHTCMCINETVRERPEIRIRPEPCGWGISFCCCFWSWWGAGFFWSDFVNGF